MAKRLAQPHRWVALGLLAAIVVARAFGRLDDMATAELSTAVVALGR